MNNIIMKDWLLPLDKMCLNIKFGNIYIDSSQWAFFHNQIKFYTFSVFLMTSLNSIKSIEKYSIKFFLILKNDNKNWSHNFRPRYWETGNTWCKYRMQTGTIRHIDTRSTQFINSIQTGIKIVQKLKHIYLWCLCWCGVTSLLLFNLNHTHFCWF